MSRSPSRRASLRRSYSRGRGGSDAEDGELRGECGWRRPKDSGRRHRSPEVYLHHIVTKTLFCITSCLGFANL